MVDYPCLITYPQRSWGDGQWGVGVGGWNAV